MKKLFIIFMLFIAGPAVADIVLTIPEAVRSEIGAATTIGYDTLRMQDIRVNVQNNTVSADFELFVNGDNSKPVLSGIYTIDTSNDTAKLRVDALGIDTGYTLSVGQRNGVISNIDAHRDNIENSMISFGLVDGTQQ